MDHVDEVLAQWKRERPDLDVSAMGTTGRVKRLAAFFLQEMEATWAPFDLHQAAFDVLATLRRSGPPYALTPGELMASTMVTSGTMTNRIDQLEKVGWVAREQMAHDKRSYRIGLTPKGRAVIDKALNEHVQTLHRLTSALSKNEQKTLNALLRKALLGFERSEPSETTSRDQRARAPKNSK